MIKLPHKYLDECPELINVIKECLTDPDIIEPINDLSLYLPLDTAEEQECRSRDGFISYVDGAVIITGFQELTMAEINVMNNKLPQKVALQVKRIVQECIDKGIARFKELFAESILKEKIPQDKISLEGLFHLGCLFDELDECIKAQFEDITLMYVLQVYYYGIDNDTFVGTKGEHTFAATGRINWEYPYHRSEGQYKHDTGRSFKTEWLSTSHIITLMERDPTPDITLKTKLMLALQQIIFEITHLTKGDVNAEI